MSEHRFQWNLPDEAETEITVLYSFHPGNGKQPKFPGDPDSDPPVVEDIRYIGPPTGASVSPLLPVDVLHQVEEDSPLWKELEEQCWNEVEARRETL